LLHVIMTMLLVYWEAIVFANMLLLIVNEDVVVTKTKKDIQGRWKSKGRIFDIYDDVELPYPDAKLAKKVSIGGTCGFYLFPMRMLVLTTWLTKRWANKLK
jgi:hypothetical protein